MIAYAQHDDTYFSRRSVAILLIIGLHVGIVYAFMSGIGHTVIDKLIPPMKVVPMENVRVNKDPPPLPTANVNPNIRPDNIVTPELNFEVQPLEVKESLFVQPEVPSGAGSAGVSEHLVQRLGGGPGKGFPHTDDFYPADAVRIGQEGAATVRTCVDQKGRLTTAPAIVKSSGTSSLDGGALRLAKAGSGHYRPTTEDGQPVSSCFDFSIVFQMRKY